MGNDRSRRRLNREMTTLRQPEIKRWHWAVPLLLGWALVLVGLFVWAADGASGLAGVVVGYIGLWAAVEIRAGRL